MELRDPEVPGLSSVKLNNNLETSGFHGVVVGKRKQPETPGVQGSRGRTRARGKKKTRKMKTRKTRDKKEDLNYKRWGGQKKSPTWWEESPKKMKGTRKVGGKKTRALEGRMRKWALKSSLFIFTPPQTSSVRMPQTGPRDFGVPEFRGWRKSQRTNTTPWDSGVPGFRGEGE